MVRNSTRLAKQLLNVGEAPITDTARSPESIIHLIQLLIRLLHQCVVFLFWSIFNIWVRYGRADFFSLVVLYWASLTVVTSLLVLVGFASSTNQLEYFGDLKAFFVNLLDRAFLLESRLSSPRKARADW